MTPYHRPTVASLDRRAEQVPQARPGDEREQAHLQAVEHPPEEGRGEG